MATRTDSQRYDQALQYIRSNISADLAAQVDKYGRVNKDALGKKISLSSAGYWNSGTDGQHMAVRALVLCQQIFLKPPIAKSDLAGDGSTTKRLAKTFSETQVRDMIRIYARIPNVTLSSFANTARQITDMTGDFNATLFTRTRAENKSWGGTSNCYSAVKIWLFKSGLCSLQWLLNEGSNMNAYTVNTILGDGEIVSEDRLDSIPEGWIFNIHDADDPNICHWGVSLGGGLAAASNTTAGANVKKDKVPTGNFIYVDFQSGNSGYGIFTLKSSVEVCKNTYSSGKVVVKKTNPLIRPSYY